MQLYYSPGACSLADHIVLEWVGASYETVRLTHAGLKSPEYLAINDGGTVPLLVDGDFFLTENGAILTYVADLYPHARLVGDGTPRGRAEVMRWLGFLNSELHPAFKLICLPFRCLTDEIVAGAVIEASRMRVREYLARLDARLEGRDWLTGERSIADPYLYVMLRWTIRFEIGLYGFANLIRFAERMYQDAGVRAAITAEEDGLSEWRPQFVPVAENPPLSDYRRVS